MRPWGILNFHDENKCSYGRETYNLFFKSKVFGTNFRGFILGRPKFPIIETAVNTKIFKKWTNAGLLQILLLGMAKNGAQ